MKHPKRIFILMTIFLVCGCTFRERLEFNNGQVYYQKPVEKEQAAKLGHFLVDFEFFSGKEKSVFLENEEGRYVVRFMVLPNAEKQQKTVAAFKTLKKLLSKDVFPDLPVDVLLVDSRYRTIAAIE